MKKVIFIVSVLGLLCGCKKEKVEPVEVGSSNPNSANGRYDQPKSAEILQNDFKFQLAFVYNTEGLVTNITSSIDSLKGSNSEKYYEIRYDYQNGLVLKISYKTFLPSFLVFAEPEPDSESEVNYLYDGSVLKQVIYKNDIKIDKTEQNSFFYDLDGNVDYILTKILHDGNVNLLDSTNFNYTTELNIERVTQEKFINTIYSTLPYGATPKDTGSNGFVRFEPATIYSFSELELSTGNNIIYNYSKLEKRFQLEVEQQILGYIGITRVQLPIFLKYIKPYFVESRFESGNKVYDYEYKVNDKGQLINFTPKLVGRPNVVTSFDQRTIKISY